MAEHQLLNQNQFGYLKGKSTLAQMLSCYNDWCTSRNSSKATDVIFLDFSKAFDRVPHERLLLKLNRHGIDGNLLLWLRNFLTERKQRVNIRGSFSTWSSVKSGVSQGSVLGPILFLIYVNDLADIVTSDIKLFADDTKIYRQLTEPEDINMLKLDLLALENWATNWQVNFNPNKCEVMKITHKKKQRKNKILYFQH